MCSFFRSGPSDDCSYEIVEFILENASLFLLVEAILNAMNGTSKLIKVGSITAKFLPLVFAVTSSASKKDIYEIFVKLVCIKDELRMIVCGGRVRRVR